MNCLCCNACLTIFRVIGQEQEIRTLVGEHSEFWPNGYKCILCDSKDVACVYEVDIPATTLSKMKIRDLQAVELYMALYGEPLPQERACDLDTVKALLESKRITKIFGEDVPNTTRSTLEILLLEDGTRIHLGSSVHGAIVYRIVKPHSFAENVK